ncbi:exodeoxyribonuclease VII large subunit [Demequina sp.]|uniref:exodeoxyribonuclease VII large subunit n=1 Tax=Demequina sp. TaxID=2050685 RepID=UPI003D0D8E3B
MTLPDAGAPLPEASASLPATASETTRERPWPVRHLSPKIGDYISKMSPVWVEGQLLNVRRWKHLVFVTLRDTEQNMSLRATVQGSQFDALGPDVTDGSRVVLYARPTWYQRDGSLTMDTKEIATVGIGDLLARIEALKEALAEEGLFAPERKVPLPFVPRLVGLICANQGDAEHDVVENAQRRWPAVQFVIRRVTVQGARCVPETTAAIRELDANPEVDVIVVARGGGSFEDLLPFSDETLVRVAAACETPLVSAIGHEKDSPLLDLVADYRASTPTDAGKRIVPDAAQELAGIEWARESMARSVLAYVERGTRELHSLRSRPVLARPAALLAPFADAVATLHERSGRALVGVLAAADARVRETVATLRALSPQATLERGFAVVQDASGAVLRDPADVAEGAPLRLRLARGELAARAVKKGR